MSGFSSYLYQKAAGVLSPTATPASPTSTDPNAPPAAAAAAPVAATSRFSLPSFSLPGLTLPSLGLGIIPTGIDNTKNTNPWPTLHIYPKVLNSGNPDYTVDHASLLGAMHFPPTWMPRQGKKPVILVPGTGCYGGSNFNNNFTKLLLNSDFANPIWLNIPGAMCDESPKNAEYVAYAIHYVYGLTGQKVTLIAWSQGNLACQWSLKYFPWTRNLSQNLISISADFHGTLLAFFPIPNSPAILHQQYTSNFIRTLRANGGDSAYIPTTSIYSSVLDEIVQPQAGSGASAWMNDERKVGVLNVDLQQVCPLTPAGGIYGHAGVLYNGLTWALAKDAILTGGAASLERIDVPAISMQLMAPGLTAHDVTMTLGLIPVAGANIVKFFPKHFMEAAMPLYCAAETAALGPAPPLSAEHQAIVDQSKTQSADKPHAPVVDPALHTAVQAAAAAAGNGTAAQPATAQPAA